MRLGQNFLVNKSIIQRIIDSADIKSDDVVVEVGPGRGALTYHLADRAKKVVAVEKDRFLAEKLEPHQNLEVFEADILKFNKLPSRYKLVANLPYYITSPIIRFFLENKKQPKEMIIMVQKEVAERMITPGNILYLSIAFYAEVEKLFTVSRGNFRPIPKVDSAVVRIKNIHPGLSDSSIFFPLVKKGFSQKRKQLGKLLDKLWLERNGIDCQRRAETLTIDEWLHLTKNIEDGII